MKRLVRMVLSASLIIGSLLGATSAAQAAPELPPCIGFTSCTLPLP